MMEDWQNGGFGLYVHWPFCQSKCPYCDFNSHVSAHISHDRWRQAYLKEIARMGALLPDRKLDSIFFGGGTPSLMDPETVHEIVSAARRTWRIDNALEVTLEANPSSVEIGRFRDFSAAGVARVSLGVQALRDDALKALGRRHSVAEALKAWETANRVFERTSLDIIYARQDQGVEDWREELAEILALGPRHLSLYQLTIESGTAFGDRYARGTLRGLPAEDDSADQYDLTQEMCAKAGLDGYEISNHCAQDAECRHNLIYWRYGDYAGIGPGAHGRVTIGGERFAQTNVRDPQGWLNGVLGSAGASDTLDALTAVDQGFEYLLMSLRLKEGSDLDRFTALAGQKLDDSTLANLVENGFLWRNEGWVGATDQGRPVLNSLLREMLPSI
jgi:putative oxygen-independent coproporphyrinogen III oxidase